MGGFLMVRGTAICEEFDPPSWSVPRAVCGVNGSSVTLLMLFTALDKTNIVFQWSKKKFELVTYDAVFDIASMVLYGAQGVPFRLHVCLYRLLAQLKSEEAVRITDQFGWSWTDFCRGWIIMVYFHRCFVAELFQ